MNLKFDFDRIDTTSFGVGRKDENADQQFNSVPVDAGVQTALQEMIEMTWREITTWCEKQKVWIKPIPYDPSDKQAATEYRILSVDSSFAKQLFDLHCAYNIQWDHSVLDNPNSISCYFTKLTDHDGNRLTAVKRATQFKGDLNKKLIITMDDTLKVMDGHVFRLDIDFDLIVDDEFVHIWRPKAFEFLGNLKQVILDSVPQNIEKISQDLPFLELDVIQRYASNHSRAARYLASIRTQNLKDIRRSAFEILCKKTNVNLILTNDNKISVDESDVMGLLEVLDRRRYEIELVHNQPERFRAASREVIYP